MSEQGGRREFQPRRQAVGHGFGAGHCDTYFHGTGGGQGEILRTRYAVSRVPL